MRIETKRLMMYPLTDADLITAAKDLKTAALRFGASLPPVGFWEMRAKRRVYRAKSEMIAAVPRAWLLTTSWLIVGRENRTVIGEAGLKGPPAERHTVEIGYGTMAQYRNRGYMTEAVGALTLFALFCGDYRVECVKALTLPGNIASHRVLEKNKYIRRHVKGKYWLWERGRYPEDDPEEVYQIK
jgi:RimJ/RimL family protein N-acetyltransferase